MNFQKTMEAVAGREMSEAEALKFAVDQWGLVVSWMRENEHLVNGGYFTITRLHRDDFIAQGYDPKTLDDSDMRHIASNMADVYMETGGYWEAIDVYAEDYKLSKVKA